MINLFDLPKHQVRLDHDKNVLTQGVKFFEQKFADYVGAKYACGLSSATNAIYLAMLDRGVLVKVPTMIPPVVVNALYFSDNRWTFTDNTGWVGHAYVLYDFGSFKIIDSAQEVTRDQFKLTANDDDLMIFSFYPTKPVGGIDGGIVVSNDFDKINKIRVLANNGMTQGENSWDKRFITFGQKMYMSAVQADFAIQSLHRLDSFQKAAMNNVLYLNNRLGLSNTSCHLYRVSVPDRDDFIKHMGTLDIMCGVHYKCLHNSRPYATYQTLPNSEKESQMTVSIPFQGLTKDQLDFVADQVQNWINTHG